jgi:hypothetical protein
MQVDEAGDDVQAGCIDDIARPLSREVGRDRRHFSFANGHVEDRVDPVLRIDDVSVPDQQIELGSLGDRLSGTRPPDTDEQDRNDAQPDVTRSQCHAVSPWNGYILHRCSG